MRIFLHFITRTMMMMMTTIRMTRTILTTNNPPIETGPWHGHANIVNWCRTNMHVDVPWIWVYDPRMNGKIIGKMGKFIMGHI
jgi:hypothetical protein